MSNYGKYLTDRKLDLNIGINNYSEPLVSLSVIGKSDFKNEIISQSKIGIGTTTIPQYDLDIYGNIAIREELYDKNVSAGDTNQVLVSTGDGIEWADVDSVSSFNGITIEDEGITVGTPGNITALNFQGQNISATAEVGGFIATITVDPFDAAGENTQIQYNDEGSFAGAETFVYSKLNDRVGIGTTSIVGVTRTLQVYGEVGVQSSVYSSRAFISVDNIVPVFPEELASKSYVDNFTTAGLTVQQAVSSASTTDLNAYYDNGFSGVGAKLWGVGIGTLTVDGYNPLFEERVLVKDQNNLFENGYYFVNRTGSASTSFELVRSTDFDEPEEITAGAFSFVLEGELNSGGGFVLITKGAVAIGTSAIEFTQFSSPGEIIAGDGLTKVGNVIDVNTANSNRIVVNADNIDLAPVVTSKTNLTTGFSTFITGINVDGYGRVTGVITANTVSLATSTRNGVASFAATQFNFNTAGTPGLISLASTTTGAVLDAFGTVNQIIVGRNAGILNIGFATNISIIGSVTAQSFSGDGSNLTGIAAGVGIRTTGGVVGTGYTTLEFRGAGISTISTDPIVPSRVIINIEGGRDIDSIGSANQVLYKNSSNITSGSANLTFNGTNLVCGGTVTANSDRKLKKNIRPISNALEKTLSLNGVEFDFTNRDESSIGFIAQEAETVVPELVFGGDDESDLKSIAYQNFVALLVEAIKEQQEQINNLKTEINNLKHDRQ
jgi:hypothetical protein